MKTGFKEGTNKPTSSDGWKKASVTYLMTRALRRIYQLLIPQTQTQSRELFLYDRDAYYSVKKNP